MLDLHEVGPGVRREVHLRLLSTRVGPIIYLEKKFIHINGNETDCLPPLEMQHLIHLPHVFPDIALIFIAKKLFDLIMHDHILYYFTIN